MNEIELTATEFIAKVAALIEQAVNWATVYDIRDDRVKIVPYGSDDLDGKLYISPALHTMPDDEYAEFNVQFERMAGSTWLNGIRPSTGYEEGRK